MAKKTKEAKPKKEPKPVKPVDPVKTRNLLRLLHNLALLLAIAAFLLQLFAVLTRHWKWQKTDLRPLIIPAYNYADPNIYQDSRLDQTYGLYSRDVRLYANNDQQLDVLASTRFPRLDEDEAQLNYCFQQTSTLRGAVLTCSERLSSPTQCHCRRYVYWNWVIFFEIFALVLLGIALFLTALQTTQFQGIFKPAAAGLALLAFISLLVGLILILSHLKRETRSIADTFPHIHQRYTDKINVIHDPNRARQYDNSLLRRALVRRQTHETYRVYSLLPGQHPYNATHYQEYSEIERTWVYKPYSGLQPTAPYVAPYPRGRLPTTTATQSTTTVVAMYNEYGPLLGYNQVFDNTRAGIGWSTILSIIAMILSLLLPLLLIFSWLTGKKLGPEVKTVTTTTVKTEYAPVPQEVTIETAPAARSIPTDYDPRRPIGDALVTAQNVRQGPYDGYATRTEPVILRDVIIRDEHPGTTYNQQYVNQGVRNGQEHAFPVNVETSHTTYRT